MQKWEYKHLFRVRTHKTAIVGLHHAKEWDKNIVGMLPELGEEGWELVAITSRSGAALDGLSGFTNEELWVFKRPLD